MCDQHCEACEEHCQCMNTEMMGELTPIQEKKRERNPKRE